MIGRHLRHEAVSGGGKAVVFAILDQRLVGLRNAETKHNIRFVVIPVILRASLASVDLFFHEDDAGTGIGKCSRHNGSAKGDQYNDGKKPDDECFHDRKGNRFIEKMKNAKAIILSAEQLFYLFPSFFR